MSFTTTKKALFELLQKAYPIVPAKSSLQVLSNFRMSFSDGTMEIMATDLDHSIRVCGPVSGDDSLEVSVNAKKIFDVVREIKDGNVSLKFDENVLIIESEDSFLCKIAGADTQDFPSFPEVDSKDEFDVPSADLKDLVPKSSFAVSRDETRACLCGVLWEIEKNRTGMIATDGHRLGSSFREGTFSVQDKTSGIISPKSLIHLVRILVAEQGSDSVHVALGDKYVHFTTESFSLCSKLIEGPYPDYEKVIPKTNPKVASLEKSSLQEAVRRVSVLSNQKTHLVRFTFTKDILEIVVLNRDIGGEARQKLPIQYDGEEHVIGLNAAYLSEIISIISAPRIRFEMNTQISACLIFGEDDDGTSDSDDLYLIMPLRIMEDM